MVVWIAFIANSRVCAITPLNLRLLLEDVSLWLFICLYSWNATRHLWYYFYVPLWVILGRFMSAFMSLFLLRYLMPIFLLLLFLLFIQTKKHWLSNIISRLTFKVTDFSIIFVSWGILFFKLLRKSFRLYNSLAFLFRSFRGFKDLWLNGWLLHFHLNYLLFIFRRKWRHQRVL